MAKKVEYKKTTKKSIAAVAEIADRTAYTALINDYLDSNIVPGS